MLALLTQAITGLSKISNFPTSSCDCAVQMQLDYSLIKATKQGDLRKVGKLIAKGAHINAQDAKGCTCLHWAANLGHTKLVNLLLNRGCNPKKANKRGLQAIHYVTMKGDNDCLELLLKAGSNVNATNSEGQTPLMYASYFNKPQIVECLLKAGAKIQERCLFNETALHFAAFGGCLDSAQVLIAAGASTHATNSDGKTPQDLALQNNHQELALILVPEPVKEPQAQNDILNNDITHSPEVADTLM